MNPLAEWPGENSRAKHATQRDRAVVSFNEKERSRRRSQTAQKRRLRTGGDEQRFHPVQCSARLASVKKGCETETERAIRTQNEQNGRGVEALRLSLSSRALKHRRAERLNNRSGGGEE